MIFKKIAPGRFEEYIESSCSTNHPGAYIPFLKIILVQNSQRSKAFEEFMSPKQQRRPMSSLQYKFFLYGVTPLKVS